jgi:hypothetical protein
MFESASRECATYSRLRSVATTAMDGVGPRTSTEIRIPKWQQRPRTMNEVCPAVRLSQAL